MIRELMLDHTIEIRKEIAFEEGEKHDSEPKKRNMTI
jgi:hypothetical protein